MLCWMNNRFPSKFFNELEDGDARAAYRNTQFDFRSYHKLKMFIHAESPKNGRQLVMVKCTLSYASEVTSVDNLLRIRYSVEDVSYPSSSPSEIWPDANIMEISILTNLWLQNFFATRRWQTIQRSIFSPHIKSLTEIYNQRFAEYK